MDGQTDPNYRKSSLLTILTEFFQNKDSVLLGETLADMVQSNEKLKKRKNQDEESRSMWSHKND